MSRDTNAPAPLACRSSSAGLLLQGRKNRRDARMNEKKDTKKRIRTVPWSLQCLDIEGSSRRRPSDDQVWLKIKDKTGVTNSTSFQQLDENKREEIFLELKDCGASLRQLERLTGIGKGVIHRIWCAGR